MTVDVVLDSSLTLRVTVEDDVAQKTPIFWCLENSTHSVSSNPFYFIIYKKAHLKMGFFVNGG